MNDRIEAAAQAINQKDVEHEDLRPWIDQDELVRDLYRAQAAAAIDAYHTLSAEQWEELQYTVARGVWAERAKGTVHPNYRFNALADPLQRGLLAEADAALTALGFRRVEEPQQ